MRSPALPLARSLARLPPSGRRGEERNSSSPVAVAAGRVANGASGGGSASDALRFHYRRELLLVPLHALLSAEERQPGADAFTRGDEGADRCQSPLSRSRRRIADYRRGFFGSLLPVWPPERAGRSPLLLPPRRSRPQVN